MTFDKVATLDAREIPATVGHRSRSLARLNEEAEFPLAKFQVRNGDGPAGDYYGWGLGGLCASNYIPSQREDAPKHTAPLVEISYFDATEPSRGTPTDYRSASWRSLARLWARSTIASSAGRKRRGCPAQPRQSRRVRRWWRSAAYRTCP